MTEFRRLLDALTAGHEPPVALFRPRQLGGRKDLSDRTCW